MHGIAAWSEWLTFQAPIWRRTSCLAIHHIAGDGEHRECCASIPVQLMLAQLCRESLAHLHSQGVDPIVIVAEARQLQTSILPSEADGKALLIPDWVDLPIADGSQGVGHHRQPGNPEGHQPVHVCVVEGHLHALIVGIVVRIVDAIHGVGVELGHPGHGNVEEETRDSIKVQRPLLITCTNACFCTRISETLAQHVSMALVTAAVEAHQQQLHEVRPSTKELHINTNSHRRDTACNRIV
mmetsp:Transcript_28900/g.63934  ORF Transcript_28900/g.63934 Transcript_28900/m.63934 type:complete len:240 (+) Transcript_28900:1485-2204(+)